MTDAARLAHLRQILLAGRQITQLVAREKARDRLISRACETLVGTRGYHGAWIAAGDDHPIATASVGWGCALAELTTRQETGAWPACRAAASESPAQVAVLEGPRACRHCPLFREYEHELALVALLVHDGRCLGMLGVSLPRGMRIDDVEISLVRELSRDIAFGLHSIEIEAALDRSREAMRAAQRELELTLSAVADGIWKWDVRGNKQEFSRRYYTMLGYEPGEFSASHETWRELIHPDDREAALRVVEEHLAEQADDYTNEFRMRAKDGRYRWIRTRGRVVERDSRGRAVRMIGSHEDLTAQKRGAERSRSQKVLLETIAANLPDICLTVLDQDMRIAFTSGRAFSDSDAAPGQGDCGSLAEVFGESSAVVEERCREVLSGRKASFELAVADRYLRYLAVPLHGLDGRFDRVLVVVEDTTEQKALEAKLVQADRMASMGMLAAGVAHEINNPLSYILYNLESLVADLPRFVEGLGRSLESLASEMGDGERTALLETHAALVERDYREEIVDRIRDALEGARRVKEIVRGLGTFSRVGEDRRVPVDVGRVICTAMDMARNQIKYRARFVSDLSETSPVTANDGRLCQVFLNLLVNAAQSIDEGNAEDNEVGVRTWQEGDEVVAEVWDTGRGIAVEHLERLFDPFFTTKKQGVGTGLGLSISNSIVREYGGRIDVTSEPGVGSRFVVRLPVHSAARPEVAAAEEPRETPNAAPDPRGRILVIDDEAPLRAAMRRMLRGYDVVEAASGDEGRRLLTADSRFDVVLCDMMMPGTSGVELHRWLMRVNPGLAQRVVFVTGGAFTPRTREYLAQVGNTRIEKPFDVPKFQKMVAELVSATAGGG